MNRIVMHKDNEEEQWNFEKEHESLTERHHNATLYTGKLNNSSKNREEKLKSAAPLFQ